MEIGIAIKAIRRRAKRDRLLRAAYSAGWDARREYEQRQDWAARPTITQAVVKVLKPWRKNDFSLGESK